MGRLLAQRLNADRSDLEGSTRRCGCGQQARFNGYRSKTFRTALGPLTLERAYYHCGACGQGSHPRDAALGLEGRSVSPGLERMIGSVAAQVSFARSSELLRELAGLHVPTTQVEHVAKALGKDIAADERQVVAAEPARAPTAYLGMDGTGVPMRAAETAGRAGKQPDGGAKTRESKLVTYWTAEQRNAAGRPERDPGSVRVSAAIESAASRDTDPEVAPFGLRLRRMAARCSYADAAQRVVLGDGAAWIWKLTYSECPGAIQIVDLWHAKEKLWECGKALWGAGALRRSGGGPLRGAAGRAPPAHRGVRGLPLGAGLFRDQPRADALRRVPGAGPVRRFGGGRSGLQDGRGGTLQALRDALDGGRSQRHPSAALLRSQRALRGLLGAPCGGSLSRFCNKSDVHPSKAETSGSVRHLCRCVAAGTLRPAISASPCLKENLGVVGDRATRRLARLRPPAACPEPYCRTAAKVATSRIRLRFVGVELNLPIQDNPSC